jgi:hypothetical protein
MQRAPLYNPRNRSVSWCLCQCRPLQGTDARLNCTTLREPEQIHSPRTPSASGSNVPPCPTFTLSLRALFLPALFPSLSSSTKRRELQKSFFNWPTMCMDVGPDGFIMPKSPDRGNEAGVFGILKRYGSRPRKAELFVCWPSVGRKRERHRVRCVNKAQAPDSAMGKATCCSHIHLVIPASVFLRSSHDTITYKNVLYYPETKHLFSPDIEFTLLKDRPLAIEKCQHSVKPVTKECPTHKQSVVFLCPSFVNRRNLSLRKPGRIKCIESFR